MSMSGHVQTKHEIKYGGSYFGWNQPAAYAWLADNGVSVYSDENCVEYATEWEIEKAGLKAIPESAFEEIDGNGEIDAEELRQFVEELLEAPTGDYAYVSWF